MTLEREKVREKIIAATLALLDEGGLEKVKARSVSERTGVSVGTIYNFFGNVDGLLLEVGSLIFGALNALGQEQMKLIDAKLQAALARGELADTPQDKTRYRLLSLSEVYIGFVDAHARRWGAVLAFNRSRPAPLPDWYVAQMDALISIVSSVLEESPLGTQVKSRALAARALWSAVHGIVTLNYLDQPNEAGKSQTQAQIEVLISYFVTGLYADAA